MGGGSAARPSHTPHPSYRAGNQPSRAGNQPSPAGPYGGKRSGKLKPTAGQYGRGRRQHLSLPPPDVMTDNTAPGGTHLQGLRRTNPRLLSGEENGGPEDLPGDSPVSQETERDVHNTGFITLSRTKGNGNRRFCRRCWSARPAGSRSMSRAPPSGAVLCDARPPPGAVLCDARPPPGAIRAQTRPCRRADAATDANLKINALRKLFSHQSKIGNNDPINFHLRRRDSNTSGPTGIPMRRSEAAGQAGRHRRDYQGISTAGIIDGINTDGNLIQSTVRRESPAGNFKK
uniref:Uncharacterized protein n=1 Tax=Branchiostoma floridae TaxID=7739 RepID=C3YMJ5_BRAFL|eukprot:XP_002602479.1 hypothetical protein BRAFLDRAFT_86863 [Branchiostoma floridae]